MLHWDALNLFHNLWLAHGSFSTLAVGTPPLNPKCYPHPGQIHETYETQKENTLAFGIFLVIHFCQPSLATHHQHSPISSANRCPEGPWHCHGFDALPAAIEDLHRVTSVAGATKDHHTAGKPLPHQQQQMSVVAVMFSRGSLKKKLLANDVR